jgi:hypothetical protein
MTMKNFKNWHIALVPITILLLLWLFTQAFHLLSAPSDSLVVAGAALLGLNLFIIISLILFIRKKIS